MWILDWILEWRKNISARKEGSGLGGKLMAPTRIPTIIGTCLERKQSEQQVGVPPGCCRDPSGAASLVSIQHHTRSLWPLWFFLAWVYLCWLACAKGRMLMLEWRRLHTQLPYHQSLGFGENPAKAQRQSWVQIPAPSLLPSVLQAFTHLSLSCFLCKVGTMQPSSVLQDLKNTW